MCISGTNMYDAHLLNVLGQLINYVVCPAGHRLPDVSLDISSIFERVSFVVVTEMLLP